jgi:hypothetical protein
MWRSHRQPYLISDIVIFANDSIPQLDCLGLIRVTQFAMGGSRYEVRDGKSTPSRLSNQQWDDVRKTASLPANARTRKRHLPRTESIGSSRREFIDPQNAIAIDILLT